MLKKTITRIRLFIVGIVSVVLFGPSVAHGIAVSLYGIDADPGVRRLQPQAWYERVYDFLMTNIGVIAKVGLVVVAIIIAIIYFVKSKRKNKELLAKINNLEGAIKKQKSK